MEIPGFEILDKLGAGGMASVWKARQVSLDRTVAIKILSRQFSTDPVDIAGFQTEAQSAAKLKHPGIIQVYDANVIQGTYYIVMEYVDGKTTGEWTREKGKLSEKETIRIGLSVAEALGHAWKKEGLIHCDIKPDNIMVDGDGTVKVSDLGLARTIRAMGVRDTSGEVMGTPSFMSPEHIRTEGSLDCRTDIYSLGATLYYLVTGGELFGGHGPEDILRMQLTDTVTDTIDLNPRLNKWFCTLIEAMLAKDRQNRYKDWESVYADMVRVKKHRPPQYQLHGDGLSTIRRSKKRQASATRRMPAAASGGESTVETHRTRVMLLATLAVLACVLLAMPWAREATRRKQRLAERRRELIEQGQAGRRAAQEMFQSAQQFAWANPDKHDEAVERFETLVAQVGDTEYASLARREAQRLRDERQKKIREVLDKMKSQTDDLVRNEDYLAAAKLYEGYAGPVAAATQEERMAVARRFRENLKKQAEVREEQEKVAEQKWQQFLNDMMGRLMTRGVGSAVRFTELAVEDGGFALKKESMEKMLQILRDGGSMENRILASFREQIGKSITVILEGKRQTLVVADAKEGRIFCEEVVHTASGRETRPVRFGVSDLTLQERMTRMGTDAESGVALAKGMIMMDMNMYPAAREYFAKVDPLLGEHLVAYVDRHSGNLADIQAQKDLARLVSSSGVAVGVFDVNTWVKAVQERAVSRDTADALAANAKEYRSKYGRTEFVRKVEPILAALERMTIETRGPSTNGTERTAKGPTSSSDELRLREVVVRTMVVKNQGLFPQELKFVVDNEERVGLTIVSPVVTDLSALAALRQLRTLTCSPADPEKGQTRVISPLRDISPLAGLPLERLCLNQTSVDDLSALKGMKLRELDMRQTRVSDLKPLMGMPLTSLDLRNTKVEDLSPLKGMPLQILYISGTEVDDLSPLAGSLLEKLEADGTGIKDLAPLRGLPLRFLKAAGTRVNDLSPLEGSNLSLLNVSQTRVDRVDALANVPLSHLYMDDTKVKDLTPLSGSKLAVLSLGDTSVKDLEPLARVPLRFLNLSGSRVSDVSVLAGMGLEYLYLAKTGVSDLTPLKDMKLVYLDIRESSVKDLSPIVDIPLTHLDCRGISTKDLRPLSRMSIQTLWIDHPEGPASRILSQMPNLKTVNGAGWMK